VSHPLITEVHALLEPTRVGVRTAAPVVPLPCCPDELPPQHHKLSSVLVAQVCVAAVATLLHVLSEPTWAGVACAVELVVPSPSCPLESEPQQ
jgi:hypothetical protein